PSNRCVRVYRAGHESKVSVLGPQWHLRDDGGLGDRYSNWTFGHDPRDGRSEIGGRFSFEGAGVHHPTGGQAVHERRHLFTGHRITRTKESVVWRVASPGDPGFGQPSDVVVEDILLRHIGECV